MYIQYVHIFSLLPDVSAFGVKGAPGSSLLPHPLTTAYLDFSQAEDTQHTLALFTLVLNEVAFTSGVLPISKQPHGWR